MILESVLRAFDKKWQVLGKRDKSEEGHGLQADRWCLRPSLRGDRGSVPSCPGLWGLVNNAGISTFGEVEFTSMETYKEVAEVNLWGTVRMTKSFLPLIRRAKGELERNFLVSHLFIFAESGKRSQQIQPPCPSEAEHMTLRGRAGLVDGGRWRCCGQPGGRGCVVFRKEGS